ncbi:hypothetical protein GGI21_000384 [Coemansia aciculifera]|nr:hypothetical protein GGI21_000384 [Coemansia aciculifera]
MYKYLKAQQQQFRGLLYSLIAIAVLTASLLLTGIPLDANDRVFATTHQDLLLTSDINHTRPIDQIIVIGDAGRESTAQDHEQRAKLCGGNLWIDHLAEAMGADLISHAHGYAIRKTVIARNIRGLLREERVKSPLAKHGIVEPIYAQVLAATNTTVTTDTSNSLYIIIADPSVAAYESTLSALTRAANDLILSTNTRARRILVIDTPTPLHKSTADIDASLRLAESIITDPSIELHTFSASRFLQQMQTEYYKYGLRFPDHPCVLGQAKRCRRPDRFFWCEHDRVGSKAHFFLADEIIQRHFMSSINYS